MSASKLPVYGLTGGIASGKSTVARAFSTLGVPVVDADQLARQVVEPGSEGLRRIVETFGPEVLLADGSLDRKALGAKVFADEVSRRRLNAITHPLIALTAAERLKSLAESGAPYALYEAALIVENQLHRGMAGLVLVAVSDETQLLRLLKRDGFSEAEARARIRSQLPLAHKLEVADFVIHNDGPLDTVDERTREVHSAILEKIGKP